MKRCVNLWVFVVLAVFICGLLYLQAETAVPGFGNIPLYFIQNRGQVNQAVRFCAKTPRYTLWMTGSELVFNHIRLTFPGADKNPEMLPVNRTRHHANYFKGNDPSKWRHNIPTFSAVLYKNLYKNINLKVYGKHNRIEYDWIVKPGGNPQSIKLKYRGAKQLFLHPEGNLVVETAAGTFIHKKPVSYQVINGKRIEIESAFKKIKPGTYGFTVKHYDKNHDLIIDPYVVYYSTYLGGSNYDKGLKIAVDGSGCAYITGETESSDFPTETPFQENLSSSEADVFVLKLSAAGDSLEYSTYLGGRDREIAAAIAVDSIGNAYLVGDTWSWDFPTHAPYQGTYVGSGRDAYVVKLSPDGASLVYSTFLGGASTEVGNGIAVDANGSAYVTGITESFDFPTQNAFQGNHAGGNQDAFVSKFSPGGDSLVYSTFLGGGDVTSTFFGDMAFDIAVDSSGCAYVTGITYSSDFPTVNAYQWSRNGSFSNFLTKFSSSGDSLVYSTYIGGSSIDFSLAVAVDGSGCAYIAGYTSSTDFPTYNAFKDTLNLYYDGFVSKFSPSGSSLEYSTYLGGTFNDHVTDIAVDDNGCAYVTGYTASTNYPVLNPFQQKFGGGYFDAFFTKLSAAGNSLVYSSLLGGNAEERAHGIAVDNQGSVYLTGFTYSSDFPLQSPVQSSLAGAPDAFVTKLLFEATYQLKVQSTGSTGVPITVTPVDKLGDSDGSTDFTRTYAKGTNVNLTAPAAHNLAKFLKWTLSPGGSEFTTAAIQVTVNRDQTVTAVYQNPAKISLDRTTLIFAAINANTCSGPQQFAVDNSGDAQLDWTVSVDQPWLLCSPTSGTNAGVVTVTVNPVGLMPGSHTGRISVSGSGASNSPQVVEVTLNVTTPGSTSAPFGTFETPTAGTTIRSSVPFTGWVLDDIGVESVKIYNGSDYIDDAVLVEGARPDVEQAYSGYPLNYKAGWGYMMLTNFLPNGGNGTYTFHAIATDKEGNQKTLGTKTVTIDNVNAVKPFGAIDTPTQGGTASGTGFINWGWVLTPQPDSIPTDGSTINVWVNGVNIGHPAYNNYRADIAALFPGYANSNGAVGYFYLDTTAYENGVHTIQWTATDSGGNTDGIGSRYFTIRNIGQNNRMAVSNDKDSVLSELSGISINRSEPVGIKKGYKKERLQRKIYPGRKGMIAIQIKELERIEIHLTLKNASSGRYTGYMVVGHRLKPLPIGSTLDPARGVFYWQPGPGFIGNYRLEFVKENRKGKIHKISVEITIVPKFQRKSKI